VNFYKKYFFPKNARFVPCFSGLNRVLGLMNLDALLTVIFLVKKHPKIDKKIQNRSNIQKVNKNEKHPKNAKHIQNEPDFPKVNKNVNPSAAGTIQRALSQVLAILVRGLLLRVLGCDSAAGLFVTE
jgi:hypothetical protein